MSRTIIRRGVPAKELLEEAWEKVKHMQSEDQVRKALQEFTANAALIEEAVRLWNWTKQR